MLFHTLLHYAEVLAITNFKICQYIPMTDSPNLMLAKVSRYMVYHWSHTNVDFQLPTHSNFQKYQLLT